MSLNLLALVFALCAGGCVMLAALTSISSAKGRIRLVGSVFIGLAIVLSGLSKAIGEGKPQLGVFGLLGGILLMWLGLRKYRRDPEGRTPPARIL